MWVSLHDTTTRIPGGWRTQSQATVCVVCRVCVRPRDHVGTFGPGARVLVAMEVLGSEGRKGSRTACRDPGFCTRTLTDLLFAVWALFTSAGNCPGKILCNEASQATNLALPLVFSFLITLVRPSFELISQRRGEGGQWWKARSAIGGSDVDGRPALHPRDVEHASSAFPDSNLADEKRDGYL